MFAAHIHWCALFRFDVLRVPLPEPASRRPLPRCPLIVSVRARIHQVEAIVAAYKPAIIGLQETKVQDSEFPHAELAHLDYDIIVFGW